MNILLTNDDGIFSKGLRALYKQFALRHCVTIVAPDRERSAVGHGITLNEPLRATRVEIDGGFSGYAVSGTPTDCIKLGVLELLDSKPDVVISGINPGANVGVNINYSGTVAAAKEAALYGIPAIAASVQGDKTDHYADVATFLETLTEEVFERGLPFGTCLNVNIPNISIKESAGIRFSRQGTELFPEHFDKRVDPRNRTYYWQGYNAQFFDNSPDIDGVALYKNFITITPIQCDMTNYSMMEDLKAWNLHRVEAKDGGS
jgi:5'-nucleotidase